MVGIIISPLTRHPYLQCSGISAIICIKPLERDMWVSGTIKKTGAWETETLINVIEVLNRFQNATFVGK